jgi:hypothetical protein
VNRVTFMLLLFSLSYTGEANLCLD